MWMPKKMLRVKESTRAVLTHCSNRSNVAFFSLYFYQDSLRLTTACDELIFHKSKSSISHTERNRWNARAKFHFFTSIMGPNHKQTRKKYDHFFLLVFGALSLSHITGVHKPNAQLIPAKQRQQTPASMFCVWWFIIESFYFEIYDVAV